MRGHKRDIAQQLAPDLTQEVRGIRRHVRSLRSHPTRLRFIFNDSVLAREWISTSDLVVVSGLTQMAVHTGLSSLLADEAIEGKSMSVVSYYEALSQRRDKAARLLTSLAATRIECPPDEVPLAAMLRPDVERDVEGHALMVQATGFYFRSRQDSDFTKFDSPSADHQVVS